jgi:hypothetical protein
MLLQPASADSRIKQMTPPEYAVPSSQWQSAAQCDRNRSASRGMRCRRHHSAANECQAWLTQGVAAEVTASGSPDATQECAERVWTRSNVGDRADKAVHLERA